MYVKGKFVENRKGSEIREERRNRGNWIKVTGVSVNREFARPKLRGLGFTRKPGSKRLPKTELIRRHYLNNLPSAKRDEED